MAVVLRLKRTGRRNRPHYRICVFDSRTRRDGRSIEELGHYDPLGGDGEHDFTLNEERARHWLSEGAQPSQTVASLLKARKIEIPFANNAGRRRKAKAAKKS
ncbi:MAG TPA: 30S ribosomal protein S16 [Planctomycetota bacterium]